MSSVYTGPRNPNPAAGEAGIVIYGYIPSLPLAIVAVVTFFATFLANAVYMKRKGPGYRSFHGLLAFGSLMECGGYAARIYNHFKPFVVVPFIVQYFLIVVAPVLFTAAIYLSLTLLVQGFPGSSRLLILKPKIVLAIFITADTVTTGIQVAGAALIGVSQSAISRGETPKVTSATANNILLAGLAIQTFFFLIFLTILSIAIIRAQKPSHHTSSLDENGTVSSHDSRKLKLFLYVILVTSLLILLRTVFRLAETAQGFFSYASTHEYLFGILEYTPVIVALIIWIVFPPGKFINRDGLSRTTGEKSDLNHVDSDQPMVGMGQTRV